MKTYPVTIRFCVELTDKQMLSILKKDDIRLITTGSLFHHLSQIENISDVDYDGMFGAAIWYTVEVENISEALHQQVRDTIKKYIGK
jgi:hypothetical protein